MFGVRSSIATGDPGRLRSRSGRAVGGPRAAGPLLAGLAAALAPALSAGSPELALRPERPRPGDAVRLELRGAGTATGGVATLLGYRFRLAPTSGGLAGHLALPVEAAPGPRPLEVRSGTTTLEVELVVRGRRFRSSRLRVAPRYAKRRRPPALEARLARERAALRAVWAPRPETGGVAERPQPPVRTPRPTAVYGTRRVFNGELKSRHYGLDLRGRVGTPVFSVLGGRVVLVAERFFSGGTVVVDHGGGLFSLYFHLSRWNVKVGDAVARGARIGAVGRSGRVTGPHLHLGVAVRAEPGDGAAPRGLFVDPEPILAGALGP